MGIQINQGTAMSEKNEANALRLLTRTELARLLGRSVRTIDRWIEDGYLPEGQMISGRRYWRYAEVEARLGLSPDNTKETSSAEDDS